MEGLHLAKACSPDGMRVELLRKKEEPTQSYPWMSKVMFEGSFVSEAPVIELATLPRLWNRVVASRVCMRHGTYSLVLLVECI